MAIHDHKDLKASAAGLSAVAEAVRSTDELCSPLTPLVEELDPTPVWPTTRDTVTIGAEPYRRLAPLPRILDRVRTLRAEFKRSNDDLAKPTAEDGGVGHIANVTRELSRLEREHERYESLLDRMERLA